jgi:hypothetical protein
MFTSGLYGYAESFVPLNSPEIKFTKPKWVIQAEQQFPIEKAGTPAMAENLIELCRDLHIRPEWFVMDRTGNATGLTRPTPGEVRRMPRSKMGRELHGQERF